ncbi:MAG: organomercurial lyase [Kiritimatiellae bacterium]|nr:organomercurial lyase [Kiritimatiellia bacterium]MDD5520203.1 organomercurial lyase [Kiritimatiellia bacterium]
MYSCLTENKTGFEKKVSVTDWATGNLVPISDAVYVYGIDAKAGRPTIKAFAGKEAAEKERQSSGGNILDLAELQKKELANKCGFCDRAVYYEDAAKITLEGKLAGCCSQESVEAPEVTDASGVTKAPEVTEDDAKIWGCCSHCALGVAARTGQSIEIHEKDRLTGEKVIIKILSGSVASLDPDTAVAWFGQRTKPDGKRVSAGCFHQGFFTTPENLKKWVEANPLETGEMITIHKALADKMALSKEQIKKACKIGECIPK